MTAEWAAREVGRRARARRELLKLSQEDASYLAGVSVTWWSDFERGTRTRAELPQLLGAAHALGMDSGELLKGLLPDTVREPGQVHQTRPRPRQ
ncbi:Transcriptional regulator, contains XRE-family HTH domain [Amycolatopsis rubida]|uniref:Transcriptional regulator, contains XRE-family HTH domain n=1 Tax=Amycolatopsis rubida TaxID=112413 RepID=A0A1I6BM74_9PSEU|nr:Transcriptional regulator, contains XRE-family HTH domain [Amycolatopsis rubida]